MNHIVHDTDRDGWGSAALLSATVEPTDSKLYQVPNKQVVDVLNRLQPRDDDSIHVLDLAAPDDWSNLRRPACEVVWLDHHVLSWSAAYPSWIRVLLPPDDKPTTTMSLLVQTGLVSLPGARAFIAGLCRRSPPFDWGLLFDAIDDRLPKLANFPALLRSGPYGAPVPAELQPLLKRAEGQAQVVESVLDASPTVINDHLVVCRLGDAQGIRLRFYSLSLARRYPDRICVLVHRQRRLYVGRNSRARGPDLMAHFSTRGLQPKGHGYVCFVEVPAAQIENELAALTALASEEGQ